MTRRNVTAFGLIFIIFFALFLPFYFLHKPRKQAEASQVNEPLQVHVMQVSPEEKETELTLPSFLEAINITPIWARTNGYLIKWYVDIGDKVKAGDLLATIDTPSVDEELNHAQGVLAAAVTKENIAKVTKERGKALYEHNKEAISLEEIDQLVAAHEQAVAEVEAAKGNVGRVKYLQGFKNLYAPFDGIIIERNVDIGSLITEGSSNRPQQLFKIAKYDVLRAFVDVPQAYFSLIKDGVQAEVTVPEFPGKIYLGKIDRNAGALNPVARTLLTQVNIENKKGELLPGLYADVKFKFKPDRKSFVIPIGALIIRSGPPYVAIVTEDNTVRLQEVKIGRDFGSTIEIIEGLTEGDTIISPATAKVKEGIKVIAK